MCVAFLDHISLIQSVLDMKTETCDEVTEMSKCKITVLKRCINQEIISEYISEKDFVLCPKFQEGQEFILESAEKPENFCGWAWADIQRDIVAIMYGADFPWFKEKGKHVVCCTDGFRPVVFLIERI